MEAAGRGRGGVVYSEFNEYHLVLRLLFSYFKPPNIITKLLCPLGYYVGGLKYENKRLRTR